MAHRFRPTGASSPQRGRPSEDRQPSRNGNGSNGLASATVTGTFSPVESAAPTTVAREEMEHRFATLAVIDEGVPQEEPPQSPVRLLYEEFIPDPFGRIGETRVVNIGGRSDDSQADEAFLNEPNNGEGWGAAPYVSREEVSEQDLRDDEHRRYVMPGGLRTEMTYKLYKAVMTDAQTTLSIELDEYNAKSQYGRIFNWRELPNAWQQSTHGSFMSRTELDDIIEGEMSVLLQKEPKRDMSIGTEVEGIPREKIWISLVPRTEEVEEDKELAAALLESAETFRATGEEMRPVMIDKGTQLSVLINIIDCKPVLEERFNNRYRDRFQEYLRDFRQNVDPGFNPFERPAEPEPTICGIGRTSADLIQTRPVADEDYVERGASPPPPIRRETRPSSPTTALSLMFGSTFRAPVKTDPGRRV